MIDYTPYRFGLIVTGKGEAKFLARLFRSIMSRANCIFYVVRRVDQRDPITAPKRQEKLRMVGSTKRLPTKDEEDIGLTALGFLRQYPRSAVILIDDLERRQSGPVFQRYRDAFDQVLATSGLHKRASVHFLVNMLEAYYFAHADAVNRAAGNAVLTVDHPTDVEQIGHPKGQMKAVWFGFDEIEHGGMVIGNLDLDHVLSRPCECCWLRSLFFWCVDKVSAENLIHDSTLNSAFCRSTGQTQPVTYPQ